MVLYNQPLTSSLPAQEMQFPGIIRVVICSLNGIHPHLLGLRGALSDLS